MKENCVWMQLEAAQAEVACKLSAKSVEFLRERAAKSQQGHASSTGNGSPAPSTSANAAAADSGAESRSNYHHMHALSCVKPLAQVPGS